MIKLTINEELRRKVEANRLLRSPHFFRRFLDATKAVGLIGEEKNALVVFLVGTSRLLAHPVNLFVKGASGSGKNFIVKNVLKFFPLKTIAEITSSSAASWNYMGRDLQHRIIYIQEENRATGNVHPARLLISENQLIRVVTERKRGKLKSVKRVTQGPVACISTTTKNRLSIDDETRHISIWVDDSPEQTKKIIASQLAEKTQSSDVDLALWHEVQTMLALRAKLPIEFGTWGRHLIEEVWTGSVGVRRYFEAFREICKVVCLVRSFQRDLDEVEGRGKLEVGFADFAVASMIFDTALSQSLSFATDDDRDLAKCLDRISERKKGAGVSAHEVGEALGISQDRAYAQLRGATERGSVRRVNAPERGNKKLYLSSQSTRMLPSPKSLFKKIGGTNGLVRFIHPVTGEEVEFRNDGAK